MKDIKIFITAHKQCDLFENEILKPIQIGASLTNDDFGFPFKDNIGANISEKRERFCELTAQYWAWKNIEADYYGFWHYRRFMALSDDALCADNWQIINEKRKTPSVCKKYGFDNSEQMAKFIEKSDVVIPFPVDLEKVGSNSVFEQWNNDGIKLKKNELKKLLECIEKVAPEMLSYAQEYLNGSECYICNMFIMKKELFHEYAEFLFKVLDQFESNWDFKNYNVESLRTPGHFGERLLGIFITYLKHKRRDLKIKNAHIIVFEKNEKNTPLLPAFSKNVIPIVVSSSDFFAKFLYTMLLSLKQHSTQNFNYDIVVLTTSMSNRSKYLLQKLFFQNQNFSIRFYNPEAFFESKNLRVTQGLPIETYFRIVIPEILPEYDKILYLDGDMVILDDVANLYAEDISNYYIGAVTDICGLGNINGFDEKMRQYYLDLGFEDCHKHINAGVMLMNTKKIREEYSSDYLIEFAQQGNFIFEDQDLFNIVCNGKIKYLSYKWNCAADPADSYRGWVVSFAPKKEYENFLKAQEDPSILHYAGNEKPWKFPNMQYAEIFWSYFRNTPYYEEFLYETFKGIDTSPNELSIRIDNLERNLKSRKFLLKWIIGEGRFGKFVRKIWRKLRRR